MYLGYVSIFRRRATQPSDIRLGFASGSLMFVICLVWVQLAWAHGDISKLPNSVQIMQYRLLIYMDPDDLTSRNSLAIALYRTNELEEAEKELRYIIERDFLNFDAQDGLGFSIKRQGYLRGPRGNWIRPDPLHRNPLNLRT